MLRSNLLFVHIISAMALFLTLGIEAVALSQLRRATDGAAARSALGSFGTVQRLAGPSMLLLLLSGLYLTKAFGEGKGAWIALGLVGLVTMGGVGGLMTGRRVRRLRKAVEAGGDVSPLAQAYGAFRTSYLLRLALATLVVYLMTVKPG